MLHHIFQVVNPRPTAASEDPHIIFSVQFKHPLPPVFDVVDLQVFGMVQFPLVQGRGIGLICDQAGENRFRRRRPIKKSLLYPFDVPLSHAQFMRSRPVKGNLGTSWVIRFSAEEDPVPLQSAGFGYQCPRIGQQYQLCHEILFPWRTCSSSVFIGRNCLLALRHQNENFNWTLKKRYRVAERKPIKFPPLL